MTNPRIHPQDPANPIHPGQHIAPSIEASDNSTNATVKSEPKSVDFSIFDHVILLNDDDTAFNEAYIKSQHHPVSDLSVSPELSARGAGAVCTVVEQRLFFE